MRVLVRLRGKLRREQPRALVVAAVVVVRSDGGAWEVPALPGVFALLRQLPPRALSSARVVLGDTLQRPLRLRRLGLQAVAPPNTPDADIPAQ